MSLEPNMSVGLQVAHVNEDVTVQQSDASGTVPCSWAAQQLSSSADFAHGSWLWTHISGGLNYQAVHHLFPGVAHTHYPALGTIIKAKAAEHGIPYKIFPSFWAALAGHFRHLRALGAPSAVPSMHTVG